MKDKIKEKPLKGCNLDLIKEKLFEELRNTIDIKIITHKFEEFAEKIYNLGKEETKKAERKRFEKIIDNHGKPITDYVLRDYLLGELKKELEKEE